MKAHIYSAAEQIENMRRNASELSEIFASLAGGEISSAGIPAYKFQPPLDAELAGFTPLMNHWQWREPLTAAENKKSELKLNEVILNRDFAEIGLGF